MEGYLFLQNVLLNFLFPPASRYFFPLQKHSKLGIQGIFLRSHFFSFLIWNIREERKKWSLCWTNTKWRDIIIFFFWHSVQNKKKKYLKKSRNSNKNNSKYSKSKIELLWYIVFLNLCWFHSDGQLNSTTVFFHSHSSSKELEEKIQWKRAQGLW